MTRDLNGLVFNDWTVLSRAATVYGPKWKQPKWNCRCSCGVERAVFENSLVYGTSKRCAQGHELGKQYPAEHRTWAHIKNRCSCPTTRGYLNYGGRGISVCARWQDSFAAFLADMGPKPTSLHSIDRINNDGNYEPGNCRWATLTQQARNKRRTRRITLDGATRTMSEWAEFVGVDTRVIWNRCEKCWSDRDAVFGRPVQHARGEAHGKARLTEAAVLDARARHSRGESAHAIAVGYGVHPDTVKLALARKTWRHVA